MDSKKIKSTKERVLKEAEQIIEEFANKAPYDELEKERQILLKKIKKQKVISLFLFFLLIISILLK